MKESSTLFSRDKFRFASGKEETPEVTITNNNHPLAEKGDILVHIDKPVSLETLRSILGITEEHERLKKKLSA